MGFGEKMRRKTKEEVINKIRKDIIGKHKLCKGEGFKKKIIKDEETGFAKSVMEPCSCVAKFEFISKLILSNIPYEKLKNQKIYEKMVIDELTEKSFDLRKEFITPYINNLKKVLKQPYGFFFTGKNGTGKTFVSWKILYYAILKEFTAHNIELSSYLKLLRTTKTKEDEFLIKEISDVDILMLDEVGNESVKSDFVIGEFKTLIKQRIDNNKPTILISNFSFKDFCKVYGVSIRNVVESHMKILSFNDVPDIRATKEKFEMDCFYYELGKKKKSK